MKKSSYVIYKKDADIENEEIYELADKLCEEYDNVSSKLNDLDGAIIRDYPSYNKEKILERKRTLTTTTLGLSSGLAILSLISIFTKHLPQAAKKGGLALYFGILASYLLVSVIVLNRYIITRKRMKKATLKDMKTEDFELYSLILKIEKEYKPKYLKLKKIINVISDTEEDKNLLKEAISFCCAFQEIIEKAIEMTETISFSDQEKSFLMEER